MYSKPGQTGSPTKRSNLLQRIGIVPPSSPPTRPTTRASASADLRRETLTGRLGGAGTGTGVKTDDDGSSGKVDTWEGFFEPGSGPGSGGGGPRKWHSDF
ncbi:stress response protein nst1 [Purpureocillium lavendulum]|uniref:Stress response protein nst1 n=1 Tax=Purpureocillium lavendulum TaxID=1247861 RepID=A0AB34G4F1_9HYPO|nr:stress response protein nst1 [Purpureocillium lavendulum]